jgi:hypothetical protein
LVRAITTSVIATGSASFEESLGDRAVLVEQWQELAAAGLADLARHRLLAGEALATELQYPGWHYSPS